MRNPGLVIYVLMKRTICKVIFASSIVVVLFLFVCFLMILLLNQKILKTQKSKMGALVSSKVPAGVIVKVLAEPK